ncbi:hypothetical protein BpHYR1_014180 [Brachionus plicatilis]|uniref:Uncharacterized protein n=1 Tax=Brachionus plicatilis TaxID=10195 RepID=A0A3M7SFI6_BRAPC|nr:hypothetical protein BpHYR1_014180 [Brachionus plicatilis]
MIIAALTKLLFYDRTQKMNISLLNDKTFKRLVNFSKKKNLKIENGSKGLDYLLNSPAANYGKYNFFDFQNPDGILNGEKPRLFERSIDLRIQLNNGTEWQSYVINTGYSDLLNVGKIA